MLQWEASEKDAALLEESRFWWAWLLERPYRECGKANFSWNEECPLGIPHKKQRLTNHLCVSILHTEQDSNLLVILFF